MGKRRCVTLSCVKTWFMVFAAILWFAAAGLFGIGLWTLIAKNHYESLLGSVTYITSVGLMISGGVFSMFVCIFGIVGAIRESRFMVLGFTLMIAIVCIIEVAGGIIAYIYKDDIKSSVARSLNVTIATNYGMPGQERKTVAIDKLQKSYKCCGDVDYKSWDRSEWKKSNMTVLKVPNSCCILPAADMCGRRDHPSNIWRNDLEPLGCFHGLEQYLIDHLFIIGVACVTSGVAQTLSMVLSVWLYRLIVEFR